MSLQGYYLIPDAEAEMIATIFDAFEGDGDLATDNRNRETLDTIMGNLIDAGFAHPIAAPALLAKWDRTSREGIPFTRDMMTRTYKEHYT